jgi:hypothetical protein
MQACTSPNGKAGAFQKGTPGKTLGASPLKAAQRHAAFGTSVKVVQEKAGKKNSKGRRRRRGTGATQEGIRSVNQSVREGIKTNEPVGFQMH